MLARARRPRWVTPTLGLLLAALPAAACADDPAAATIVIRPEGAPGPLDNPLKGWCPYTDANPIRRPYAMVYLYATWRELEPTKGQYAFEAWERRAWSRPSAEGKHVVFRIVADYPGHKSDLPEWLVAEGVKRTPYTEYGGGQSPDYDDPRMVEGMERLIAAAGQRYDGNPRVAFIELGLLGYWGEWHTYPSTKLYASRATEARVIAAYRRAFPHKHLMARDARDDAGKQPWLGFHDDMFPEDTDNGQAWSFLAKIRASGRAENWQVAPIGGEMVPNRAKDWLGPKFDRTLATTRASHFSWVGPYCPALDPSRDPTFVDHADALVRLMGYQYRLTEVRLPKVVTSKAGGTVTVKGENEGVAPFYYPWPVELALLDPAGRLVDHWPTAADVRRWLPGPFAADLALRPTRPIAAGTYRLALGIRDPWRDAPAIAFANKLDRVAGWSVLGSIRVE